MIVLDTNVVSELFRREPDARVVAWIESLDGDVAITTVTLAELLAGVRRLPEGRRKSNLEAAALATADAQIAAICRTHDAVCATRNMKDFVGTGIELIDPWGFSG